MTAKTVITIAEFLTLIVNPQGSKHTVIANYLRAIASAFFVNNIYKKGHDIIIYGALVVFYYC